LIMAVCADVYWTDLEAQPDRRSRAPDAIAPSLEAGPRIAQVCLGAALRAPGSYPWLAKFQLNGYQAEKENLQPSTARSESSTHPSRTVIVFDWDDTLFPLTHVFQDLHLDVRKPLEEQPIPEAMKRDVAARLAACAEEAAKLLTMACTLGRVMIVTLSKESWVVRSCRNFCPKLQETIEALGLTIIYALESRQGDYPADGAKLKAEAIRRELCASHACKGRWLNILSVGDSDFERFGVRLAAKEYACSQLKDGLMATVRTKTMKTMDKPTTEELTSQLGHLAAWLPLMTLVPCDLDLYLSEVLPGDDGAEALEAALAEASAK